MWTIIAGVWLVAFVAILVWPRPRRESALVGIRRYHPTRHLVGR